MGGWNVGGQTGREVGSIRCKEMLLNGRKVGCLSQLRKIAYRKGLRERGITGLEGGMGKKYL